MNLDANLYTQGSAIKFKKVAEINPLKITTDMGL
jgi:hypothetical protein